MHLASIILLAAAGVSAHPSGHAHMHARYHAADKVEKREEWITATINDKVVSWINNGPGPFRQAVRPTPAPASEAPSTPPETQAVPTVAPANFKEQAVGNGAAEFAGFEPCGASKKRATLGQIMYKGNTGCSGYGSNIKMVKSTIADRYQYTVKVVSSGAAMQCKVWNKIGRDGGINGFFSGNEAVTFDLPAGGIQYLAFDHNSQTGMTCGEGGVPLTSFGQFNGPWAEFDMGNESNGGWSGFDASQLVAGAMGGAMKKLDLCLTDGTVCSKLFEGGGGDNAFLPGDEAKDGIGGNIPPGSMHLVATF
jgi:hypothetical protein